MDLNEATEQELVKALARLNLNRDTSTRYVYDGLGQRFEIAYLSTYRTGKRQYTCLDAPFDG
jgi:hypothetical protein